MRILLLNFLLAAHITAFASVGAEVEGVQLQDTVTLAGTKLVLNGAGFHKRGFFKTNVQAVYVIERQQTLEGLTKLGGPKRIHIHVLKEIPGATISRYFLTDFKLTASDVEFKQLINEVSQIGNVYGGLPKVIKGDVITIDWIPGKGIQSTLNAKPMAFRDNNIYLDTPNAELMYKVFLRMYVGPAVPEELRLNQLGLSRSMNSAAAER